MKTVSPPGKAKVKKLKEGQEVCCPNCGSRNFLISGNHRFGSNQVKVVWYCFGCQRDFLVVYVAQEIIGWHKSKRPGTGKR